MLRRRRDDARPDGFLNAGPRLDDAAGIRAAYDAHGPELYRLARRQLGDDGAAQDVVQEVFLRAWKAAATFDPDLAGLRVWLFAIARNVVIDEVRRARVRPWQSTLADPDVERPTTVMIDDQVMDSWVIEEALRRIGPEHRAAIVEIHLRGRPAGEVAAELGVPPGTLRSRIFYGLKALRLAMDEMGVEP